MVSTTLGISEASKGKKMRLLPSGSHSLDGEIYDVVREIYKIQWYETVKEEL